LKPAKGRKSPSLAKGSAPARLVTPQLAAVRKEFARAKQLVSGFNPPPKLDLVVTGR